MGIKYLQSTLAILSLIVVCALMSACTSTKAGNPNQLAAYEAAMAGKSDEVRALLKLEPGGSFNIFLLACIELSDGNLSLSRVYADRYIVANPYAPDGKVLVELIEERRAYPEEPWLMSFASAWKAAGSPELKEVYDFLERDHCEESPGCSSWKIPESFVGQPEELIAALDLNLACNEEEFASLCLSKTSPETPIPIRLLALSFLNFEDKKISDSLLDQIKQRRNDTINELSDQLPSYMVFPLVAKLDQVSGEETFSSADIDEIERIVSRPKLSPLLLELYDDYLARFIAVGSSTPYMSASGMAILVDTSFFTYKLRTKALATSETASPEVRNRLAAILEKVAKAQIEHKTMVGSLFAIANLHSAASIRKDKREEERLQVLSRYTKKLMDSRILNAAFASRFWPIQPLMINATEMAIENEVGVHQLFSDTDIPAVFMPLFENFGQSKK